MYIKNKNCTDYTEVVKDTYKLISERYGYTARISDIWKLLQVALGIEEFELLSPEFYQNGEFYAYLIDRQIDWQQGKDVDFSEIYNTILETGDFSQTEKMIFSSSNIEERLWAIYLAICDPAMNL